MEDKIMKTIDDYIQCVNDVLAGKYGNNNARKINVSNAGYNFDIVQNMVNEIIYKRLTLKTENAKEIEIDLNKYNGINIKFKEV